MPKPREVVSPAEKTVIEAALKKHVDILIAVDTETTVA